MDSVLGRFLVSFSFFAVSVFGSLRLFAFIRKLFPNESQRIVFFHPFCDAGGGGERVLWVSVRSILDEYSGKKVDIAIISASERSKSSIFSLIETQFGLKFSEFEKSRISFLEAPLSNWLLPQSWSFVTIFGQNLSAIFVFFLSLAFGNFFCFLPDVFIDTTGFSFIYPFAWILGSKIIAYVHYPTMTPEAVEKKIGFKKLYHLLFLTVYRFCGGFATKIVTNSRWTNERLRSAWNRSDAVILYPPVKIEKKKIHSARENAVVSLGQFRPEKNHAMQLRIFARLKNMKSCCNEFWMIGGARDAEDLQRVENLKKIARDMEISVNFFVNLTRDEVDEKLSKAKCAIHTMVDEHFGISLIEFMAAGLPVVAHRSGGPEKDILNKENGFLAETVDEFANFVDTCVKDFDNFQIQEMIIRSTDSLSRFNDDKQFGKTFAKLLD